MTDRPAHLFISDTPVPMPEGLEDWGSNALRRVPDTGEFAVYAPCLSFDASNWPAWRTLLDGSLSRIAAVLGGARLSWNGWTPSEIAEGLKSASGWVRIRISGADVELSPVA